MYIKNFIKKNFKYLKLFVIFLCFVLIVISIENTREIISSFKNIQLNYIYLLIILGIVVVNLYSIQSYFFFKKNFNLKVKFFEWSLLYFNTQFLESIPFLGTVSRAIILKKKKIQYKDFFLSYFFLHFLFCIVSFLLFTFEIYIFVDKNINLFGYPLYAITFLFFILFLISTFFINFYKFFFNSKFIKKIIKNNFILSGLIFFLRKFSLIIKNKNYLIFSISIVILIHFFEFLIFYISFKFFNFLFSFQLIVLLYVIKIIIGMFLIVPKNYFVTELGFSTIINNLGYSFYIGFFITILIRLVSIISITLNLLLINIYRFLTIISSKNKIQFKS